VFFYKLATSGLFANAYRTATKKNAQRRICVARHYQSSQSFTKVVPNWEKVIRF